ncbi:ABC transporter substrate-binding protein [uncultured Mucilaginibacter sp.]|uniref:ABC transporter substrate-binding protein n=1 Tax=uncultured Mucilaginibacter sp. TaxID=797541 RepID=UPI0026118446|nr:ABC transporter substrate-binding protein [uncultured Mucilaginibacter sp.]
MNNHYNKQNKGLARNLRNNSTPAEIRLWSNLLRAKGLCGYSFLRQRPIGNYVADFFCKELQLVIELDGRSHQNEEQAQRDVIRDDKLKELGYTVIRFEDDEVLYGFLNVVRTLEIFVEEFEERKSAGHPPNPLQKGEEGQGVDLKNSRNLLSILLLALFFLCGCFSKDQSNKTVFNINLDDALTSLDPAFARNQNAIWCDNQLYNGLVQLNDSLKTKPSIAKSWEVSADGLHYTFHLRNDVFFHDAAQFKNGKGRKAVAADFVYSFYRLIDAKVGSTGSWIFSDKVAVKEAFQAPNDSTFIINLRKPFPPMMSLLTAQYCAVVPHEVVDFYGKDFRSHPIGTGPFQFKYWKEGEVLVFLKNENYWETENGRRLPYLDAVRASFITNKQTAFMEFVKHNLDFFNDIDGSYRDDILTKSGHITKKYQGKFQLKIRPYLNTEYLGMLVDTNLAIVKTSPLRFKKVRQAINYAIDREKMVKYLRNNVATPGHAGFVPVGMPGFEQMQVKGYRYDPEKARQLLAEAGFYQTHPVPEILLNTTTTYRDLIEFVQGQLNAVGIPTRVEVSQGAALRERIAKNSVNFFRANWMADYPDAENYLSVFYSHNKVPFGPNYTAFYNKDFDQLFEASYQAKTEQERFKLYRQMDNLVMEQAPVVILYYYRLVNLYQNNISGISTNAQNLLVLKRVRKGKG